jgi:hypothetical protein
MLLFDSDGHSPEYGRGVDRGLIGRAEYWTLVAHRGDVGVQFNYGSVSKLGLLLHWV